jgi:hypothetical protein
MGNSSHGKGAQLKANANENSYTLPICYLYSVMKLAYVEGFGVTVLEIVQIRSAEGRQS